MSSFTEDGNVGAGVLSVAANAWRRGFNRARGMQGNPTASIMRYTVSGRDAATGTTGTRTLVTGLADRPVLVDDFSESLARKMGEDFEAGLKVFEFAPDSADQYVISTDRISWSGDTYKPKTIKSDTDYGKCVVIAEKHV